MSYEEKRRFRHKLDSVYNALCTYLDEKTTYEIEPVVPDIKLRYAIILAAVHDMHYGDEEQQADAMKYFSSDTYLKHKNECLVPSEILDAIVFKAKEYASFICYRVYNAPEDEESDLL